MSDQRLRFFLRRAAHLGVAQVKIDPFSRLPGNADLQKILEPFRQRDATSLHDPVKVDHEEPPLLRPPFLHQNVTALEISVVNSRAVKAGKQFG